MSLTLIQIAIQHPNAHHTTMFALQPIHSAKVRQYTPAKSLQRYSARVHAQRTATQAYLNRFELWVVPL